MTGTRAPSEPARDTWVEAAQRGDLVAWERLVRHYQEPVYRVAYLIVRDTDLAEKATLSTFVRAYRALPSFDHEVRLLPWLIRIAAGESRHQRRESGRPNRSSRPPERSKGPQFPATPVPGLSTAAGLTPLEGEALSGAFDRLGEEDRLVLTARYLLGLTQRDAADALSLASGLIEERFQGALRRLRARMTDA